MAVHPHVSRNIGTDYVQVDVTSNKAPTRYFKVPKQLGDEFCRSYKKRDKRDTRISNGVFFGSALVACIALAPLTKNLNSAAKMAIGILGGITAAVGSTIATNKIMAPKHEQFVKSFKAEELYFDDKKFPV